MKRAIVASAAVLLILGGSAMIAGAETTLKNVTVGCDEARGNLIYTTGLSMNVIKDGCPGPSNQPNIQPRVTIQCDLVFDNLVYTLKTPNGPVIATVPHDC